MEASALRRVFREFFVARGHLPLPSASLIPVDPTLLFTNAGMVPFKPWFLGEETPPAPRVTTIQKCLRVGGKHNDLDAIGTTTRHLTFFEMLGNFSFGDYFKAEAIPFAWELVTEGFGFDPEQLWVTVHDSDDEAAEIWLEAVGLDPGRLQRKGEDNWWAMADTGPCGPDSEIHLDRGPSYGAEGGPAFGSDERYLEFWNLVFMQFNALADGSLVDLPRKNIDTGAGFERVVALTQGLDSVFDTDLLRPILAAAESLTGRTYGRDPRVDVSLRIMADHARATTFLLSDGVLPSNEGRGYVLRRIVRRAVRRASGLGVRGAAMPPLVEAVVDVMGADYPELRAGLSFLTEVVNREEERFQATLRTGSALFDEEVSRGSGTISGAVAFRLHDTFGFPIDLTTEMAAERNVDVDLAGFEAEMEQQRRRSQAAGFGAPDEARMVEYRTLLEEFGPTRFLGYELEESEARVQAVLLGEAGASGGAARAGEVEVFLDETPFYAEGGGQVGDTGWIEGAGVRLRVLDTTAPVLGLYRHRAVVEDGALHPGMTVRAVVDAERRQRIRRNHTGTHLLHWALRQVLGPHVRQQGSLVAPDRLRFDFSHHGAPSPEELRAVEDLVNAAILADEAVETEETTHAAAVAAGAIAFFGDRYGTTVRVVHAGSGSTELCGGTHVRALGAVGPFRILSEGSIGASTRRIEALTGEASLARQRLEAELLQRAASLLQAAPEELPERIEGLRSETRTLRDELRSLRQASLAREAVSLAEGAHAGTVVARLDGRSRDDLRQLAALVREVPGIDVVVLGGSPDGRGVALVAAVRPDTGVTAHELLAEAASLVGGGGGRDAELAVAGGRHPERIDDALAAARRHLAAVSAG
jgi:alanyl-tRNA synthetase